MNKGLASHLFLIGVYLALYGWHVWPGWSGEGQRPADAAQNPVSLP